MEKHLPITLSNKVKALAYYQLIGGSIGIILIGWTAFVAPILNTLFSSMIVFFLLLYAFSIYCGQQLLKENYKNGLKWSMINQFLQIFNFSFYGFAFKYISGIMLSVGVDVTESFKFLFDISITKFEMDINSNKEILKVGLNLFAVFVIYSIEKLQKEILKST